MARTHKLFTSSTTWTAPAGVTEVEVIGMYGMPGGPGGGGGGGGCNGTADIVFYPMSYPISAGALLQGTAAGYDGNAGPGFATSFTVGSTVTAVDLIIPMTLYTGTAVGNITVAIVADNSGAPTGTSQYSTTVAVSSLGSYNTVSQQYVTLVPNKSLTAGNYWVTWIGDATFLAGSCQVLLYNCYGPGESNFSPAPPFYSQSWNGSVWATFFGQPECFAITTSATANGGGGAGGNAGSSTYADKIQYFPSVIQVTPNTSYTVTIGAGGTGGIAGPAGPVDGQGGNGGSAGLGSDSSFKNGANVLWQSNVAGSGQPAFAGGQGGTGGLLALPSIGGGGNDGNVYNFGAGGDPTTLIANSGFSWDDYEVGSTGNSTAAWAAIVNVTGTATSGSAVITSVSTTVGIANGLTCIQQSSNPNIFQYPATVSSFVANTSITLNHNALSSGTVVFSFLTLSATPNTTPSVAGAAGTSNAGNAAGGGGWGGLSSGPVTSVTKTMYSFPPQNSATIYNKGGNGGAGGTHGAAGSAGVAGAASTVGNLVGGSAGGGGGGGSTGHAAGIGGAGGAGSSGFIILAWDE